MVQLVAVAIGVTSGDASVLVDDGQSAAGLDVGADVADRPDALQDSLSFLRAGCGFVVSLELQPANFRPGAFGVGDAAP